MDYTIKNADASILFPFDGCIFQICYPRILLFIHLFVVFRRFNRPAIFLSEIFLKDKLDDVHPLILFLGFAELWLFFFFQNHLDNLCVGVLA